MPGMRCDLHVHSALSACADNTMSPRRIVEAALARRVTGLAVADHNASGQVARCAAWAARLHLLLLPAIEVTSREEVHLLVFFDSLDALRDFQCLVDAHLPQRRNIPEVFGFQVLYDDDDAVSGLDHQLRQIGCSLSIERLVAAVHARGGCIVPAHVDRPRHSLVAQLGFVDADAGYDAVEVSWRDWTRDRCRVGDCRNGYPLLTGSDAHFLGDIGRGALSLPVADGTPRALLAAIRRSVPAAGRYVSPGDAGATELD